MPSASLYGLAVLETPRKIDRRSKMVVFDGQLFMGDAEPALLGNFRYFNGAGLTFDDVACYFVHITIAKMQPQVPTYSETLRSEEYHVTGDIIWLIPAGNIAPGSFTTLPWISATGAIANSDDLTGSFDIDADQYTSAFKGVPNTKSVFPMHCCIDLNSKRYEKTKPSLKNGRFISFTGHLTRMVPGESLNSDRFVVSIENFDFLGYAPPPMAAAPSPSRMDSAQTPATKMKFSFSTGSSSKKRKLDDLNPSSSDAR